MYALYDVVLHLSSICEHMLTISLVCVCVCDLMAGEYKCTVVCV